MEDLLKEIIDCWNEMKESKSTQSHNSNKAESDSSNK